MWSKKSWDITDEELEQLKNIDYKLTKYTPEQAAELEKKVAERVDISGGSGIIEANGLGAKVGGTGLIEEHDEPKLIKTIDPNDNQAVKSELTAFEETITDKSIETACVVTKGGEVYQCYGVADRVYPDSDLGEKFAGSSVSHYHTAEETTYSFSEDDLKMFVENKLEVLHGIDDKYIYEFTNNAEDIDDSPENWTNFENYQHTAIIYKALEYGVGYRRWKR